MDSSSAGDKEKFTNLLDEKDRYGHREFILSVSAREKSFFANFRW